MGEEMITKCLQCAGEWKLYHIMKDNGTVPPNVEPPVLREAVTVAPSWQQQQVGGQMVMACVPLPTCMEHLAVTELSAMDRAIMGGKLIPGRTS